MLPEITFYQSHVYDRRLSLVLLVLLSVIIQTEVLLMSANLLVSSSLLVWARDSLGLLGTKLFLCSSPTPPPPPPPAYNEVLKLRKVESGKCCVSTFKLEQVLISLEMRRVESYSEMSLLTCWSCSACWAGWSPRCPAWGPSCPRCRAGGGSRGCRAPGDWTSATFTVQ